MRLPAWPHHWTILEHSGLWHDPPSRAPPVHPAHPKPRGQVPRPDPESGLTYETDLESLEHPRREDRPQPNLPWDG